MVSPDPKNKYLVLDDVRVSYRPKDNTIHLTSSDADVAAAGFHISLVRGTPTEEALRELLIEYGMIRGEVATGPTVESQLRVFTRDLRVETLKNYSIFDSLVTVTMRSPQPLKSELDKVFLHMGYTHGVFEIALQKGIEEIESDDLRYILRMLFILTGAGSDPAPIVKELEEKYA